MRLWLRLGAAAVAFAALSSPPGTSSVALAWGSGSGFQDDVRLPNGKSQKDAILKEEYEQNAKDAAALVELAQQLQQEIEKNERFVLSVDSLKKTDEIEKLVKKIRSRLRHN